MNEERDMTQSLSRLFIMNSRIPSWQIKKTFNFKAGQGRECKQNVRMTTDCRHYLELQSILSLCKTDTVGTKHWKKRLISIICKYPGKIMEFSKFHLNSK